MTDNRLLLVALLVFIAAVLTLAAVYVSRRMEAIADGRNARRRLRQDEYACMRHLRDFDADERAELDRLAASMGSIWDSVDEYHRQINTYWNEEH